VIKCDKNIERRRKKKFFSKLVIPFVFSQFVVKKGNGLMFVIHLMIKK
jgi:hypothetical protein